MTERIEIGEVEIEVTFKDIKNLHLSVHPPYGQVTISSPLFYDLEKVKIYAATKLGWIKKEQRKFLEQLREEPRVFKNQESHFFFGDRYLLKLEESTRNKVEIAGKKIVLKSSDLNNVKQLQATLYAFYRKELRKYLEARIVYFAALMNIESPSFKIRTMKTKWGSCATDQQRIWFNIELAKKPLDCIDYIVVHELIHLIERHHNKRFVLLMNQYYPSWCTQKKKLNELPL
ncbi:SprT family zinc-dependent metalloprotease [Myroides odoratimimus]|uniref:M48 family metallopeptidase n=1 Tax=Myroides TaxID=76831 RepID=UPI00103C4045|nr:SprT family zinc-dependent metalloprotease [Myroides odoratimimus]MDM1442792.1 M48 family metallopeptidase [Myroides odoratimimus]QBK76674.1 M48 family peptidase [Myroides odoratimimus]WHT72086.1 SprT family zinc-dependent metalloprotease [Myroides odoratimimus]WHU36668.1 SprT family zinc-dependent metalloprotease [Myroides odoratimimus]